MKRKFLFCLIPAIFILAGCATCNKQKMNNLETRIETLEKQTGVSEQTETLNLKELTSSSAPANPAPEKPSKKDIQTSLKNAGFYTGPVDGKIGQKTTKAIEEFQKVNQLKADGKVGPKTWEKLKVFWNSETGTVVTQE